ncbi:MAG TPA: peptidylprolyl isomerase [Candidatus Competibacteraceae bacterium]|nr:peptidylprolyl isomerase [Candidatus Competibacteraceae bacterium]
MPLKSVKKLALGLALGLGAGLPAAVLAQQMTAELPDPVLIINGEPITRAQFEIYAQERASQLGDVSSNEARKTLADELVLQELLVQEAKKQGLEKDPQLQQQLDLVWRNLLATAAVRKHLEAVTPKDEEVKAEYDKAVASFSKQEFKARHILVEKEDEAKALIEKLKGGADFAQLAKDSSMDASAAEGGDLGWFSADAMIKPFADAVAKLDKGQITEAPVQTQFGWHVILLEDKRAAEPPSLAELRPQIMQMLQGRRLNEHLASLKQQATIENKLP